MLEKMALFSENRLTNYDKHIIYCFSGTGNSLRTAMKIAEEIGGAEIISVRCAPESVSAENAAIIGFICPVYEWDMPGAMKDFVKMLKINSNAYVFMVATYIAIHGKCFETMENLVQHIRPFRQKKLCFPVWKKELKKSVRIFPQEKTKRIHICLPLQEDYILSL